jgi:hypothetical protein
MNWSISGFQKPTDKQPNREYVALARATGRWHREQLLRFTAGTAIVLSLLYLIFR